MLDKITPKQPEFAELCGQLGLTYPSTVHHFERDARGVYLPVMWAEIKPSNSAKERTLRDGA